MATHYVALIDGEDGAYGAAFPDLPGCVAMGASADDAQRNAADALRDWVEVMEAGDHPVPAARSIASIMLDPESAEAIRSGAALAMVPLVREANRSVKANMSLDSSVLAAIDAAAKRLNVSRSAVVEILAKRTLHQLV